MKERACCNDSRSRMTSEVVGLLTVLARQDAKEARLKLQGNNMVVSGCPFEAFSALVPSSVNLQDVRPTMSSICVQLMIVTEYMQGGI